jgi:hypothetical protein
MRGVDERRFPVPTSRKSPKNDNLFRVFHEVHSNGKLTCIRIWC